MNWSNYDLVVIDESHNFRNNPPVKGHMTRYERLMKEIIQQGVKTKVLMLSATPVNNRMNDIKNQIAFITEGKNDALSDLGMPSIEAVLRKAQMVFNQWSALPDEERTSERFVEMVDVDYFKLLDTLTIARSRKTLRSTIIWTKSGNSLPASHLSISMRKLTHLGSIHRSRRSTG